MTRKHITVAAVDPRLAEIDTAIRIAYDRLGKRMDPRRVTGGQLVPTDAVAADWYGHAANLAQVLAADLRATALAFRPVPGADQDPGGATA
ncbi:hypothetical protein ACWEHA_35755 [Amycolatopsis nivea]